MLWCLLVAIFINNAGRWKRLQMVRTGELVAPKVPQTRQNLIVLAVCGGMVFKSVGKLASYCNLKQALIAFWLFLLFDWNSEKGKMEQKPIPIVS